jgi:hypothetical protein
LQLVAITRESAEPEKAIYAATLYDPDEDKLFVVRTQDKVGEKRVDEITSKSVRLSIGQSTHELILADGSQSRTP